MFLLNVLRDSFVVDIKILRTVVQYYFLDETFKTTICEFCYVNRI